MRVFLSMMVALKLCAIPAAALGLSLDDSRHLLMRTGFGVDAESIERLSDKSRAQAVSALIAGLLQEPVTMWPEWTRQHTPDYWRIHRLPEATRQIFREARDGEMLELRAAWLREMVETPSPMTERLVLFWHDHFVTSYDAVRYPTLLARQLETFRQKGTGKYRDLLKAMIRDPALLSYLDNDESRKDHPNENLGRETLELFTLGDGHYDEADVQAAAASLTGYDLHAPHDFRYFFNAWQADERKKRFLGGTIVDGDDLIDAILAQPRAAVFLTEKLWDHYVSNVERDPAEIERIARIFRTSDHDLKVLLQAILTSDAFWDARYEGHIAKSPIELVVGTVRSLGLNMPLGLLVSMLSDLGQTGFDQANVAGWPVGLEWLTPASLAERNKQLERLRDAAKEALPIPRRSRLQVRLAGTSYEGPPDYHIDVRAKGQNWQTLQSGKIAFARDTSRYGWPDEMARDVVWQTISVDDSRLPDQIDRVRVRFTNDHADDNGGDRNLWVGGLQLDSYNWSAADAVTRTCDETRDDGALYCPGSVTFTLKPPKTEPRPEPFEGLAISDVWANWVDRPADDDTWQEMAFTIKEPRLRGRSWRNISLRYVVDRDFEGLLLSSRDCWPDCLKRWPEAAEYRERTGERRIVITADPDDMESRLQLQQLEPEDRALVAAIGQAMPVILMYLEKDPSFPDPQWRQAWLDRMKGFAHRLSQRFAGADHVRVQPLHDPASDMAMMMMGQASSLLDVAVLPVSEVPEGPPSGWLLAMPPLAADAQDRDPWAMIFDPVYQVK